jgi:2-(1,2-epoxy-1,2-dihydrophenyl)acetyl-CoA isomerase
MGRPPPGSVSSEFAEVTVAIDDRAHDTRLLVTDAKTGRARLLDALELESVVWTTAESLAALLDPGQGRWRDETARGLVADVYAALESGDEAALVELLAEDFVGVLAAGLPRPVGGRHQGRQAMIAAWWALGRRFKVHAEPETWCGDTGRVVVTGRYRGRRRDADVVVDAAFAHIWTVVGGRVAALQQITDTADWGLGPTPDERTTEHG